MKKGRRVPTPSREMSKPYFGDNPSRRAKRIPRPAPKDLKDLFFGGKPP
jgi:hypothetical protein